MLQLIKFFTNNRYGLLFVLLEFIAFIFVLNSHSYHYSKFLNSANSISGSILKSSKGIHDYFHLTSQNKLLAQENELLKNKLQKQASNLSQKQGISADSLLKYNYISAQVISNPFRKRNNILTIDKGEKDGIKPNMGVVLSNGVVGITLRTSNHFTTVLSLLNSQTKINAKMKNSPHYGSLEWNGNDFSSVQLYDLPIQAHIKVGDTVISGGKSVIFPEGIPIGMIKSFEKKNKAYQNINIHLFADFSALNYVYVVQNKLSDEQLQLENQSQNE